MFVIFQGSFPPLIFLYCWQRITFNQDMIAWHGLCIIRILRNLCQRSTIDSTIWMVYSITIDIPVHILSRNYQQYANVCYFLLVGLNGHIVFRILQNLCQSSTVDCDFENFHLSIEKCFNIPEILITCSLLIMDLTDGFYFLFLPDSITLNLLYFSCTCLSISTGIKSLTIFGPYTFPKEILMFSRNHSGLAVFLINLIDLEDVFRYGK